MRRLPLDDPRWRPLADVYQLRRRQTGSPTLAARDITDALLQGVRCMRRKVNPRLPGPDRDFVPPEFWKDHELYVSREEVLITRRRRGEGVRQIIPLKGLAFFLWGPDVDKAWTSPTEAKTESDKGGAPRKLPRRAETEIRRRIGRGEVKFASAVAKKYPDVMDLRSWRRHVRRLRDEIAKRTKPAD